MAERKVIQFVGTDGNEYDVRDEAAQQKIGTTALPTTAQTLTGAIAEHESDLTNQAAEVNSLKSALDDTAPLFEASWEIGGIGTSSGDNSSATNRMRTPRYKLEEIPAVFVDGTALITIYCYSQQSGGYLGYVTAKNDLVSIRTEALKKNDSTKYVRFVGRYVDNSDITVLSDLVALFNFYDRAVSDADFHTYSEKTDGEIVSIRSETSSMLLSEVSAEYVLGGISTSNGDNISADNRIRALTFFDMNNVAVVEADNISQVAMFFYSTDASSGFLGYSSAKSGVLTIAEEAKEYPFAKYVRFVGRYADNSDVSSVSDLSNRIKIKNYTTELTEREKTFFKAENIIPFVLGGIDASDGSLTEETAIGVSGLFSIDDFASIIADNETRLKCFCYSGTYGGTYIGTLYDTWCSDFSREKIISKYGNTSFVRVTIQFTSGSAITDLIDLARRVTVKSNYPMHRVFMDFESGNYATNNCDYSTGTTRARHKYTIQTPEAVTIQIKSGYQFSVRVMDENYNKLTSTDWLSGAYHISRAKYPHLSYIRLAARKTNSPELTDDDFPVINEAVNVIVTGDCEKMPSVLIESPAQIQTIKDIVSIAPTMCAVKYKRESGKQPVPVGWLFRDNDEPYNFYWSSDGQTLNQIFQWDKSVTDNQNRVPYQYSFAITDEGDVICVFRGELSNYDQSFPKRVNPVVYPHTDYSHPVAVDFGGDTAPTSWLQNTGAYQEEGYFYCCEYTRFNFSYSYVWKVTAPYTNKSDWEIIKTFEVSGQQRGFKHCHMIDRDPFTGILWLSTGDEAPNEGETLVGTPGIYYSTDDGETWTTLLEGIEKYCRQLNFIWCKDYVYWCSDTSNATKHFFIRAKRDGNGVIDLDTLEEVYGFKTDTATYNICYSEKPKGILILNRYDGADTRPLDFYFWDIEKERMFIIDRVNLIGSAPGGFRVEAINHYSRPDIGGYICGFSLFPDFLDVRGNMYNSHFGSNGYTTSDVYNVGCLNNLLIRVVN